MRPRRVRPSCSSCATAASYSILRGRGGDQPDALRVAFPPALAPLAPLEVLDDEAGRGERAQVVARRAARLAQLAREHRRGRRLVRERLEHSQPQRVGEARPPWRPASAPAAATVSRTDSTVSALTGEPRQQSPPRPAAGRSRAGAGRAGRRVEAKGDGDASERAAREQGQRHGRADGRENAPPLVRPGRPAARTRSSRGT